MSKEASVNRAILRPAFESNTQAFGFLAVVVLVLILPVLLTESGMISRRDSYEIMPENQGAYTFVENEIFDNEEDIDILFIGSSVIWNAIDTPHVQKELSSRLGRPARVVTFGHYFNSIDIPYMQIRDLLQRKRVWLVVMSIPRMPFTEGPSTTAYRFIRYSDDGELFDGLPFKGKMSFYACSILRSPRDLLTLIRANRSKRSQFTDDLGADKAELGMGRNPESFERFEPSPPSIPASMLLFSERTRDQFYFTGEDLPAYQNYYLENLVGMLKRNDIPLMILNVPQYSERGSPKIIERRDWSKVFGDNIPQVGVSSAVLYAGLSDDEVERLHYDDEHINKNGSEYFTRTVLPAILEVYEQNETKSR